MMDNRISSLSGGEKRRLYLLTILMQHPNLLILDEPTNDLDIVTLNVLEEYLLGFEGSLIIVSHDRHFLDRLVGHLFVFCGDGVVKDFIGGYTEYRTWLKDFEAAQQKSEREAGAKAKAVAAASKPGQAEAPKKLSWKEQREMETLEKEVEELEIEKKPLRKSSRPVKVITRPSNGKATATPR